MNTIKQLFSTCLLAASLSGVSQQAHAGVIRIDTDKTSYLQGEWITATVRASEFQHTLSGFFAGVRYQPQLTLHDVWFGNGFDDGLGSYRFVDSDAANGYVALAEYADWAADFAQLAVQQQQEFVLASLRFKAVDLGLFQFSVDPSYLGWLTDAGDLQTPTSVSRSFTVSASVPAPAPLGLLALCGALLAWRRATHSSANNRVRQ